MFVLKVTSEKGGNPFNRGGHFTRYPKPHPNPILKTQTEIRTEVAKYPNGY